jgi:hypothetical protein
LDDWTKKKFSSAVNITDEALIMQVVKHYVPKWDKLVSAEGENSSFAGGEEGGRSEDGKNKRAGGAVKGDINTCVKQKACYYEYCIKVQQARSSKFSEKWDVRLKEEALKRMMEQEEKTKAQLSTNVDEQSVEDDNVSSNESTSIFIHGMYDDEDIGEQSEV